MRTGYWLKKTEKRTKNKSLEVKLQEKGLPNDILKASG
jgi:hypothetical protein